MGCVHDDLLDDMVARLSHRGPDDRGTVLQNDVGLGCARLSLLDFDRGAQPVTSRERQVTLVFNGEIYNYRELRAHLTARYRCRFRSHADTEVLLRGLEYDGQSFIARLEGMFALAVTDGTTLWLARDTFGMKPLFYWVSPDRRRLRFGSEIKALLVDRQIPRTLNRATLVEFATFGFPLRGHTLLDSVHQVLPGEVLVVTRTPDGTLSLAHDAVEEKAVTPFNGTEEQATDALVALLRESVRQQCVADHSVGCLLSGGVDSSIVAALVSEDGPCRTFNAADRPDLPDREFASLVSGQLNTTHEDIGLDPVTFVTSIPMAVTAAEAPVGPTVAFMSAPAIRRTVKAVLCSDGADELFGGYDVHHDPDRLLGYYRRGLQRLAQAEWLPAEDTESTRHALDRLDHGRLGERRQRMYDFLSADQLANLHLSIWDRGSMAAGLEVRLPFLNTRVRRLAGSISMDWKVRDGVTKPIPRTALSKLLPAPLADAVGRRRKRPAWDALTRCLHGFEDWASRTVTPAYVHQHPCKSFFRHSAEIVLFDAFLYLFVVRGGVVPTGFTLDSLYRAHNDELTSLHRTIRGS